MTGNARTASISSVARAPELRRVNLAFLGYSISEHATWLAVAFYAFQRGGAAEVGIAAAAQLLPGVVLTPFSSYAGDRFRPQRALAGGYAVQCMAMLATALSMGAGRGTVTYLFGAVAATAISFTRPVMGSLLPTVTHAPSDLVAANVVAGITEQIGLFVGPLLAGSLLAVSTPATVFAVGAALTGCGAIAVATIRLVSDERPAAPSGRDAIAQTLAGFATLRRSPMLRWLVVLVAGAGVIRGVGDVVFVTFADERLDGGGAASGYLAVVYGVGGLVAATTVARVAGVRRISTPFLAAGAAGAAALLGMAVANGYVGATPVFALLGAGDALVVITAAVTIQRIVPTDVLARTFGIVEGTQMGCVAAGSYLVSVLTSSRTLGQAFVVMAGIVAIVVVGASLLLRRHGDTIPPVDETVVARLLADPVFAPLPAPTIERLARASVRVQVVAGEAIVREGDHGDRYYLVVGGEVTVTIDGRRIRTLGDGSSFGEIALLRDVPRTATATASTDVELLGIDRDEFLTAVTGHPRSFGTATGVADTWLGPT